MRLIPAHQAYIRYGRGNPRIDVDDQTRSAPVNPPCHGKHLSSLTMGDTTHTLHSISTGDGINNGRCRFRNARSSCFRTRMGLSPGACSVRSSMTPGTQTSSPAQRSTSFRPETDGLCLLWENPRSNCRFESMTAPEFFRRNSTSPKLPPLGYLMGMGLLWARIRSFATTFVDKAIA